MKNTEPNHLKITKASNNVYEFQVGWKTDHIWLAMRGDAFLLKQ